MGQAVAGIGIVVGVALVGLNAIGQVETAQQFVAGRGPFWGVVRFLMGTGWLGPVVSFSSLAVYLWLHFNVGERLGVGDGPVTLGSVSPPQTPRVPTVPAAPDYPKLKAFSAEASSTLATFRDAGASFTGLGWDKPDVKKVVAEAIPLKVAVTFVSNAASGGTPGLNIRAVNQDAAAVIGAAFVVTDMRWWSENAKQFVETPESARFRGLRTEEARDLYCDDPVHVGFVELEQGRISIQGHREDGSLDHARLTKAGRWQMSARIAAGAREADHWICFEWDGRSSVKPCDCFYVKLVTTAPTPPTVLRA
jgi:hypothetical protein